ncbi:MAG: hypothetical protein K8R53_02540 [Bacteroidales bacterium]|nr:hypothetical protein [Bacteroidales bacterium]
MNKDQKSELIDKFLAEELTDEELIVFKKMLETDSEFHAEVKKQLDVQSALEALYKSNKTSISDVPVRKLSNPLRNIYLISSIAASFAILLFFGYNYFQANNKLDKTNLIIQQNEKQQRALQEKIEILQSEIFGLQTADSSGVNQIRIELEEKKQQIVLLEEELENVQRSSYVKEKELIAYAFVADKLYEPAIVDISLTRGSGAEYQKAMEAYNEKNYKEANLLFENLLVSETGRKKTDIIFYYGSSCLANSKNSINSKELLEKAEKLFSLITENPSSPLYEEAIWCLAITYLKTGNKMKSVGLLEEIAKSKSYKNNEAESLLYLLL